MGSDAKRVSIRKGGEVDGEQYYIFAVTGLDDSFASVAVTGETAEEYIDKISRVLDGELNYAAIETGE